MKHDNHSETRTLAEHLAEIIMPEPKWLRGPAAAHRLSVSERLLQQAAQSGEIVTSRVKKPGKERGVRLYNVDSLDAWVAKGIEIPDSSIESEEEEQP